MSYFFRHIQDSEISFNINIIRIIFFISIFVAYKLRNNKKILNISLVCLFILQILLFGWYLGSDDLFLIEGLPFYHCRIAAILMSVFYYLKKNEIAKYFAWLGIIGSVIAVSFPDPSKYLWPHITNITYIGSHMFLIIAGIIIINLDVQLRLNQIVKITIMMNTFILFINAVTSGNYGYLSHLPENLHVNMPIWEIFIIINCFLITLITFLEKSQNKYNIKYKKNNAPLLY